MTRLLACVLIIGTCFATVGCKSPEETKRTENIDNPVPGATDSSATDSAKPKNENPSAIDDTSLFPNAKGSFELDPALQLSQFVRRIFQDQNGHLWFGTNGDGVIRFDGVELDYFSPDEGFGGYAVRGILGDNDGNVWFGTEQGLTKFDGATFTNFDVEDGLIHNDVWSMVIDSKGTLWIGTVQGVCRFDGEAFTPFELPATERDPTRGVTSTRIVHCIMEDTKGKMWFATNGGAFIFDDGSLSNISEKDGLCHNHVNSILEAKDGAIWFATHHNGVCRWDGKTFEQMPTVDNAEAWSLFEDRDGNIWFPVENAGVYCYREKSLKQFTESEGLTTNAIQCIYEDKEGRIWLGGWKGLFRYDGNVIFSVGKKGPWK